MKYKLVVLALMLMGLTLNAQFSPKIGVVNTWINNAATTLAVDFQVSDKFSIEGGVGYGSNKLSWLDLEDTLGVKYSQDNFYVDQSTILYLTGKYKKALGAKEKAYLTGGLRLMTEFFNRSFSYTDQEISAYLQATGNTAVMTGWQDKYFLATPHLGFEYYLFKNLFLDLNLGWGFGLALYKDSFNNKFLDTYTEGIGQPFGSLQVGYTFNRK